MLENHEIEEITAVIKKAGKIILHYFNNKNFQIKYKRPHDPVTNADIEANNLIVSAIERLFPDDVIISEETYTNENKKELDKKRKNAGRLWIIDPLDGTKDFIKGLPTFAVSIGFVNKNETRYGWVFNPAENFLLQGGPNYGILLNGSEFSVSQRMQKPISEMEICISTSESRQNLFSDLYKSVPKENFHYIGSVAYKMALIVTGNFDLVLSKRNKSDWDIAGALAVLSAAGYRTLDKNLNEILLNKDSILTDGLIVGSNGSVNEYQNFLNRF